MREAPRHLQGGRQDHRRGIIISEKRERKKKKTLRNENGLMMVWILVLYYARIFGRARGYMRVCLRLAGCCVGTERKGAWEGKERGMDEWGKRWWSFLSVVFPRNRIRASILSFVPSRALTSCKTKEHTRMRATGHFPPFHLFNVYE